MDNTVSFELLQKREELRDEIRKLETEKEIKELYNTNRFQQP